MAHFWAWPGSWALFLKSITCRNSNLPESFLVLKRPFLSCSSFNFHSSFCWGRDGRSIFSFALCFSDADSTKRGFWAVIASYRRGDCLSSYRWQVLARFFWRNGHYGHLLTISHVQNWYMNHQHFLSFFMFLVFGFSPWQGIRAWVAWVLMSLVSGLFFFGPL